jgi:hypothetical protein
LQSVLVPLFGFCARWPSHRCWDEAGTHCVDIDSLRAKSNSQLPGLAELYTMQRVEAKFEALVNDPDLDTKFVLGKLHEAKGTIRSSIWVKCGAASFNLFVLLSAYARKIQRSKFFVRYGGM